MSSSVWELQNSLQNARNAKLLMAIVDRKDNDVLAALKEGADPNAIGVIWDYHDEPTNATPLVLAIERKNFYATQALIQAGANLFVCNVKQDPAICLAMMTGHTKIIKTMIEAEPKLAKIQYGGDTLLEDALFRFTAYSLIVNGKYKSQALKDAVTAYYLQETNVFPTEPIEVEYQGNVEVVHLLLSHAPELMNTVSRRGHYTALEAVQNPKNYLTRFCDSKGRKTIRHLPERENDLNKLMVSFEVTVVDRECENTFKLIVNYDFTELKAMFERTLKHRPECQVLRQVDGLGAQLGVIKQELTEVTTKTTTLYQAKAQRSQWENWIKLPGHENLERFYDTVVTKFENIFLSFKAVDGGQINPKEGKVATIRSVVGGIADVASILPLVGGGAEKFIKWGVDKTLAKVDETRELNTAKSVGKVSWRAVEKEGPIFARMLTVAFAQSLLMLPTPEEAEKNRSAVKKGWGKLKGAILKDQFIPPAEAVALLAMTWVTELLYEEPNIGARVKQEGLSHVFFSEILGKEPPGNIMQFWNTVNQKLGGITTKSGDTWSLQDMYTLTGIRTEQQGYYEVVDKKGKPISHSKKYGWRVIPHEQVVEGLKLKRLEVVDNLPPPYLLTVTVSQFNRTDILPFNPESSEHSLELPPPMTYSFHEHGSNGQNGNGNSRQHHVPSYAPPMPQQRFLSSNLSYNT